MKKTLKKLLLACPGFEALCRLLTRSHVRALMYHRFSEEATGDPRFVDHATLTAQMDLVRRHHARWTPDEHLAAVTGEARPTGACPVVVTIDDGYHDAHDIAFPVFEAAGVPAMLFVTTGFVDGSHWMWWDRIAWVLDEAEPVARGLDVNGSPCELDLTSAAGRKAAWNLVADRCRFLPDGRKHEVIADLAGDLGVALIAEPPAPYRPVTWDQVRRMKADGMDMGAHTVSHPILSRLDRGQADQEIARSGQRLAEQIGAPVGWFCYPQGGPADYTETTRELVARDFVGCYIAWQDLDHPDDPMTLPRYCIAPDMNDFRWVLCGAEFLGLRARLLLGLNTGVSAAYWSGAESTPEQT